MDKYYKIHFEDDGFASMYETDDENYWTKIEAIEIVNRLNNRLVQGKEED